MIIRNLRKQLAKMLRAVSLATSVAVPSVAVIAGGMIFAGDVAADSAFFEDFESATGTGGGSAGQFGGGTGGDFGAYATGQNYSGDDHTTALGGTGGGFYGHTIGVPSPVISDPVALGAGDAVYDFSAWLAAYTADAGSDYTEIGVEFFSDAGGTVSTGATLLASGDVEGSSTTPSGPWSNVNWSLYTANGSIPGGSVSYRMSFGGPGNDTYADNISFTTTVPEPTSTLLIGLAGLAFAGLRSRN